MRTIAAFNGEFRWLSNFWPVPITRAGGITYPSSEHAYVAAKTVNLELRRTVAALPTAVDAKSFGHKISLRSDWEQVKDSEMLSILRIKFLNPVLREKMINIGHAQLVEGNTWGDTYWGVCNGKGQNMLGKLLMQVRDEIRREDLV